jgi:dTDP-4-amino-4,6-dideoxygalactose transaminase
MTDIAAAIGICQLKQLVLLPMPNASAMPPF